MATAGGQPPGDSNPVLGLGAGLELGMPLAHQRDLGAIREAVRERLHPSLAQALELGPPLGQQVALLGFPGLGLVGHRRNPRSVARTRRGRWRPL